MNRAVWGKLDNATYLTGIREGDRDILRHIYDEFQPNIISFCLKKGVSEEEAQDVFAGALLAVFQQAKEESLELKVPFSAYLFAVCRNLLMKSFRSKKRFAEVTEGMERAYSDSNPLPDEQLERAMLGKVIRELFGKLADDCQRIIQMRWDGESYEQIKEAMGHGSEGYTRKRKHFCHKHLLELMKKDERVRDLYL
ncbi:MAG: sigma-70 family RNA polymerase sigma factor [Lewinellaceae bacterium]|nr:sigma-70 family RNA polymerase sigma factor [Lewinellaceae bacterium]